MAFPISPVDGQLYDSPNGTRYRYYALGDYWEKAGSTGNFVLGPLSTTQDYVPEWDSLTRYLKNGRPVSLTPLSGAIPILGPLGLLDPSVVPGGTSTLAGLGDVNIQYPQAAELLMYNGTYWENVNILTSGHITAVYASGPSTLTLGMTVPIASEILTSTYNFNGILSVADTDVQKALDTIDNTFANILGDNSVNIETISATKTLMSTSPRYQYLTPVTTDQIVNLYTVSGNTGKQVVIKNNASSSASLMLIVKDASATTLDQIHSGREVVFTCTASGWMANNGGGDSDNVALGYDTDATNSGVAVGYTATGTQRGVAVGYLANTNSQPYALALGALAKAERYGEIAFCGDIGASPYRAALNFEVWAGETTNATPLEIFLRGYNAARCAILASSAATFVIYVSARDNVNNNCKHWKLEGGIKRNASTTALVGAVTKTVLSYDSGASAWDVDATADDGSDSLVLTVTGAAVTINWAASGQLTEARF